MPLEYLLFPGLVGLLFLLHVGLRRVGLAPKATLAQTLRGKRKPHWCWHCKDASDHRTRHHQRALMRRVS